jgi:hypothetical protein
VRLYLPATLEDLAAFDSDGTMGVGDDVVVAEGDSEDQEYDALMTAAESAAALAAELEPGERRRVVVVAEVAVAALPATVALADVVAVHADPDDVPDAGADPDDDLGWYATQRSPPSSGAETHRIVRRDAPSCRPRRAN